MFTHYRHLSRYRQILTVFFKYGFGYVVEKIGIAHLIPEKLKEREFLGHPPLSAPQRVRMAMEELGPTFIKLGQMLSTRPDLIPMDYVVELSKLQDNVPPVDFDKIRQQLDSGLPRSVDEIFLDFNDVPVASASISQVHKAVLKSGEVVAVKVQKPGIRRIIETDIDILYALARLIKRRFPEFTSFDPVGVMDEFAKSIRKELDFKREARNAQRFASMFEDDPRVYEPKLYTDLSSDVVLVMEFVHFIKVTDIESLRAHGIDVKKVARDGADIVFKQILVSGFFHADPHPGNIGILPDGRIVFMDFGMMGRVGSELKDVLGDLFVAAVTKDADGLVNAYRTLGMIDESVDERGLKEEIEDFIEDYFHRPLKEINIGEVINESGIIALRYGIKTPAEFALLGKALFTIEDVARTLDEDFDVFAVAQPYVKRVLLSKYNPDRLRREAERTFSDLIKLMYALPRKTNRMLDKIEKGNIRVLIEDKDMEQMVKEVRSSSLRVALSIMFGSSLMAFSLLFGKLHIGDWMLASTLVGLVFIGFLILLLRI